MDYRVPILLSYYSISGENAALIFGQITYTTIKDLSFKDYSRRKTFRTLLSLYRTKPYADQNIVLIFNTGKMNAVTDKYGSFKLQMQGDAAPAVLQQVKLVSGEDVKIIEGLYPLQTQGVQNNIIVVSDIDDTLIHSFIYRTVKKFRTLMFTTMEKRRAVSDMHELLQQFAKKGAASFYLSNSEQNLYPLIYRFLLHNGFPPGPLFLKKMRRIWDVIWNIKFPVRTIHKEQTLDEILRLFPDRKFVLMGDNTQHDLAIYLDAANKFPRNIRCIIILKVVDRKEDEELIKKNFEKLKSGNIQLYYSSEFPSVPQFII